MLCRWYQEQTLLIPDSRKLSAPAQHLQQCSVWELLILSDQSLTRALDQVSTHLALGGTQLSCHQSSTVISEFTLSELQRSSQGSLDAFGISTALSDDRRASCLALHLRTDSHGPVSGREHREAVLGKRHRAEWLGLRSTPQFGEGRWM